MTYVSHCDSDSSTRSLGIRTIEDEYRSVLGHFARAVRDPVLAQDLVHDAIAETLTKLNAEKIQDPNRIAGFVFRVAQNLLRNHRRRYDNRASIHVTDAVLEGMPSVDDPTASCEYRDAADDVRSVLSQLSTQRDREVLRRFYLEGEDKASICAELGVEPRRLNSILFRARERMRALFEEHESRQFGIKAQTRPRSPSLHCE